ncbi:MAG: AbrB/MazE/SpoVT family DNA-binding domain-containing protein [Ruminococcus sp.]|nr:AbrB/MazE/SpoVT family DNA-binding domain-containing protein [Ruminococcus sp.]
MKQVGYVSKIDSLGRIVIPKPVRQMYNMEKEDAIEILAKDNGLLIRKYKPTCVFCGETDNMIVHEGNNVCEDCIKKLMKKSGLV